MSNALEEALKQATQKLEASVEKNPFAQDLDFRQFQTNEDKVLDYPSKPNRETKYAVLIDANSFAFKYYFWSPQKFNWAFKEENINMVELMLFKIFWYLRAKPDYLFVVWEWRWTYRKDLLSSYKAHRKEKEENFKWQCKLLHNTLTNIGIPSIFFDWYEADDTIKSLAEQLQEKDPNIISYVHTMDKDYFQFASDKVHIVRGKEDVINAEKFKEKFWFENKHFIKYLSCIWDKADNIPNMLAGLWEKRIDNLFKAWYYGLDDFLEHEEEILANKLLTPRIMNLLKDENVRRQYLLNQKLITLQTFPKTLNEIEKPLFDRPEMLEKFHYQNVTKVVVQAMQLEQLLPIIDNIFS